MLYNSGFGTMATFGARFVVHVSEIVKRELTISTERSDFNGNAASIARRTSA